MELSGGRDITNGTTTIGKYHLKAGLRTGANREIGGSDGWEGGISKLRVQSSEGGVGCGVWS